MEINIVTSRARVWIEISRRNPVLAVMYVTSRARVWIEITSTAGILVQFKVTSRARVWIEMILSFLAPLRPSRHFSCESAD